MRKFRVLIVLVLIAMLAMVLVACGPKDDGDLTTYTIKFDAKGGSTVADITINSDTTTFVVPTNPTKEGFIFDDWYLEATYATKVTVANVMAKLSPTAKVVTVYAKWVPVEEDITDTTTYTITFNTNEGSAITALVIEPEATLTLPAAPTKLGFIFDGWYLDNTTFANIATPTSVFALLSEDETSVTVYAKWREVATYTISFDTNEGSVVDNIVIKAHLTLVLPAAPTKLGFTFDGWYLDNETFENEATPVSVFALLSEDETSVTVYAKWKENTYTISFDTNEGSQIDDIILLSSEILSQPDLPTKEGFTFDGWYLDNETFENDATPVSVFALLSEDETSVTVYAKWREVATYTILFDTNEGSVVDNIVIKAHLTLVLPAAPTKLGFTFDGWYLDNETFENEATPVSVFALLSEDETSVTVYAKWKENTYTISFDTNEGSQIDDIILLSSEILSQPDLPTKEGFTFDGWYLDNDEYESEATLESIFEQLLADGDSIIIYVKWVISVYEVVFDGRGGLLQTGEAIQTITHGEGATAPTFTKEGYIFDGWDIEFTNITADTTVTAVWDITFPEAQAALKRGMNEYYNSTTWLNAAEEPSEEVRGQMANIKINLALVSENFEDLLDEINSLLAQADFHGSADYYMFIINTIAGYNSETKEFDTPEALDERLWQDIATLENKLQLYGSYDEKLTECDNLKSGNRYLSNEDMQSAYNFKGYVEMEARYKEFYDRRDAFETFVSNFIDTFTEDDIFKDKLEDFATYMLEFDYTDFMILMTKHDGENTYTYYDTNAPKLLPYLLGVIEASGFTSDDAGMFIYKLMEFQFAQIIAGDPSKEDVISPIQAQLSLDFITDFVAIVMNVMNVINNNEVIDLIYNNPNSEDAPLVEEVINIIVAMKASCDEFLTEYDEILISGVMDEFISIIEELALEDEMMGFMSEMFLPMIEAFSPFDSIQLLSELLGVFDADAIEALLYNFEDEYSGHRQLGIQSESEYFIDNAAILEAKIIEVISGGEYSQEDFALYFDNKVEWLRLYLPIVLPMFYAPEFEGMFGFYVDMSVLAETVIDMANTLLKDKIVITEERFAIIMTTATLAFDTHIDEEQLAASLLPQYSIDIMNRIMIFDQLFDALNIDLGEDDPSVYLAIGSMLLDVDADKLQVYATLMSELEIVKVGTIDIACLITYLFEAGFTESELTNIFTQILPYVFSYLNQTCSEGSELQLALDEFVQNGQLTADLFNFVIRLAHTIGEIILAVDTTEEGSPAEALRGIINDFALEFSVEGKADVEVVLGKFTALIKEVFLMNAAFIAESMSDENQTIMEEEIVPSIESLFGMLNEFFGVFGFDGLVDKALDIIDIVDEGMEFIKPEGEEGSEDDEMPIEILLLMSKVIVSIFGEDFGAEEGDPFEAFIAAAGEDTMFSGLVDMILAYYDSFVYISNIGYDDMPEAGTDEDFDEHLGAIAELIGNLLPPDDSPEEGGEGGEGGQPMPK